MHALRNAAGCCLVQRYLLRQQPQALKGLIQGGGGGIASMSAAAAAAGNCWISSKGTWREGLARTSRQLTRATTASSSEVRRQQTWSSCRSRPPSAGGGARKACRTSSRSRAGVSTPLVASCGAQHGRQSIQWYGAARCAYMLQNLMTLGAAGGGSDRPSRAGWEVALHSNSKPVATGTAADFPPVLPMAPAA